MPRQTKASTNRAVLGHAGPGRALPGHLCGDVVADPFVDDLVDPLDHGDSQCVAVVGAELTTRS